MSEIANPTPEDMARDAAADLGVCETATPGPWFREECGIRTRHPECGFAHIIILRVGDDSAENVFRTEITLQISPDDADLICLAREALPAWIRRAEAAEAELERLRAGVRAHRDMRGDDRCHIDDATLYALLPDGDTRPARESAVTIENCARFIECRQQGREYVSPERRIEELEAENAALRAKLDDTYRRATASQRFACLNAATEVLKSCVTNGGLVARAVMDCPLVSPPTEGGAP